MAANHVQNINRTPSVPTRFELALGSSDVLTLSLDASTSQLLLELLNPKQYTKHRKLLTKPEEVRHITGSYKCNTEYRRHRRSVNKIFGGINLRKFNVKCQSTNFHHYYQKFKIQLKPS